MTRQYDEDGDDTALTDAYREHLHENLALIDVELISSSEAWRTELQRRRNHTGYPSAGQGIKAVQGSVRYGQTPQVDQPGPADAFR